jgi:ABC-type transport system involved in multi-copper enzyme maturation permease subunit
MLGTIIKKEILDKLLSHKFLFIFILCAALILLSIYIGASDYVESKKEHDSNVSALRERMQPPASIGLFSEYEGYRIYRPPQILRTVVAGVEDAAGRASYPNQLYENNLTESKNESNTIFTLFGSLDLLFAVKFILSLCALFLTYEAVSGEKESGMLKLTLSNSVSRAQLVSGKIIGNYASMLLLFLVPLLMSLIVLLLYPGISLNGEDWMRLLSIFLMFLLYVSVFFALGIFVSAVTTRASTSFLVLLFLWIALVIVIPNASVIVAEHVRPVPASSLLAGQKSLFWIETSSKANEEFSKKMNELIPKINQRAMELQPLSKEDPRRYQEEIQKVQEPLLKLQEDRLMDITDRVTANNVQVDRDYQLKKDAQQSLAKNLSRISPASALTFGAMTLARTGMDEYDRFMAATRTYRPIYRKWMSALVSNQTANQIDENVIASIPQFPFTPESPGALIMRTLLDFALMAAMTIVFLTGAYFAFLRYDVR